jgi:hypothetical protein
MKQTFTITNQLEQNSVYEQSIQRTNINFVQLKNNSNYILKIKKLKHIFIFLTLIIISSSGSLFSQATGKFYVNGSKIIDPNGCQFIAKGANLNAYQANWNDQNKTISDLHLFKNSWKFNFARLYCRLYKSSSNVLETTDQLYNIIQTYIEANVVVMLTYHDFTGGLYTGTNLQDLINFNVAIVNHFKTHPKFSYIWFETMNEPGDKALYDIDTMNRNFCKAIRNAGATENIFCAPGNYWSQEGKNFNSNPVSESVSYILSKGVDLVNWNYSNWGNKNVIFSPHFYKVWVHGDAKMATFIDDVHAKNLALVVGEYGIHTPGGDCTPATQSLKDVGYQRKIGRCVWHWTGGDENDLTTSNSGRNINKTDGTRPTNLTWLGGIVWDDNHTLEEGCTVVSDTIAPSVPLNINGTPTTSSVSLTWNASTDNIGVAGYKVFVNGIENKTSITTSTNVAGLLPNTSYAFQISAYDASGNHSVKSSVKNISTLAPESHTSINDDQFTYSSGWSTSSGTGKYQSDDHYSKITGSYWEYTFYGTQVELWGSLASHHGITEVQIDGGSATDVDFYAATRLDETLIWTSPILSEGLHTIRVTVSGRKNTASSGNTIMADRIDILNNISTPTSITNLLSNEVFVWSYNGKLYLQNITIDEVGIFNYLGQKQTHFDALPIGIYFIKTADKNFKVYKSE